MLKYFAIFVTRFFSIPLVKKKNISTCVCSSPSVMCVCVSRRAPRQRFVWELLSLVAEEDRMDLRRYVRRATELWAKQGKLGGALVRAVCSHTAHLPHQKVCRYVHTCVENTM